jgi:ketosteroid isomerase-like protein
MLRKFMVFSVVFVVLGIATVTFAGKDDGPNAEIEKEVRQAEQARVDALLKGDAAALGRMWSDDFTMITYRGELRNKNHRVAALKSGTTKYEAIANDIVDLRIYGDTALVTGYATRKGEEAGKKMAGLFRFSRLWVKKDGRWQLVHLHFTKCLEK